MKILKILCILLLMALFVGVIQVLYFAQRNASTPSRIRSEYDGKRRGIALEFKRKERESYSRSLKPRSIWPRVKLFTTGYSTHRASR